MLKIRKAQKKDAEKILTILNSLDLYHPVRIPDDFWVALKDGKIAGVSCLTDYKEFYFLSSVGVVEGQRHNGTARALLEKILGGAEKDIYLYTIIPEFFKKFSFEIVDAPKNLPSRDSLGCDECHASNCVCMVKNVHK